MKRYFVWALAMINSLIVIARLIGNLSGVLSGIDSLAEALGFVIITVVFSIMGALIVVRTEGNRVGWLMVLLGFVLANPFATYLAFQDIALHTQLSFGIVFAFWTQGWLFFLIIYAVFLIILLFPDGRPPGPRWNIINVISLTTLGQYILVYTFQPMFGDSSLFIDNPIALLPVSAEESLSGLFFGLGLLFLGFGSIVSIIVRFRRAGSVERTQIKWLLLSGVVSFAAIGFRLATYRPEVSDWTDYLLILALVSVAFSISIAILRYRLYDIDIIIRRTLQYTLLTGLLISLYFGGIAVLQGLLRPVTGAENTPVVTVITTLALAALFNPLRTRVQAFIDLRFFRRNYDIEQALNDFAVISRDEVDMDVLSETLLTVVDNTMQPEQTSLWLREIARGR